MWKQIFKAALIAGCLDVTAACIQAYITNKVTPDIILKYIASGIFGKEAFSGGVGYMLFGLLVHFLIAFACTLFYFLLYPKLKILQANILLSALFIAVTAWAIPARLIVQLSKIKMAPFNLTKALIAVAILYCCIGLPVSYFAKRYYNKK
jgi:hypothetical protein